MSGDRLILAIDQGTSSTKALLVDERGRVVARGAHPVGQAHPAPGWVEQSATEVWASVLAAVAECVAVVDPAQVVAVGLSNQRESLLLWDRVTGEPVTAIIGWQDRRTAACAARLAAEGHGPLVREVTGLPLDPMFSATKGAWLLDQADPDRSAARRGALCLGTIDSWLLSKFGADPVIEVGNAARTQLLDVRTGAWDPRMLEMFGIPAAVLPRVVPSTGPFPAVRGLPPLPDGVPIAAVLGDSHAALFAHGGWRQGLVKVTYGTGSSVMAVSAGAPGIGLCRTIAWSNGALVHALEGNVRAAGASLRWVADLVGRTPAQLAELAATVSSDGVYLVPAFGGLAAPWWDADAHAELTGMTFGTGLPQLARAALESIAFQVDDVVSAVEASTGRVGVLLADGGAAGNPVLMQLQADITGVPVRASLVAELSSLGVAQLAGVATGWWDERGLDDRARPYREFLPRATAAQRAGWRSGWRDAVALSRTRPEISAR